MLYDQRSIKCYFVGCEAPEIFAPQFASAPGVPMNPEGVNSESSEARAKIMKQEKKALFNAREIQNPLQAEKRSKLRLLRDPQGGLLSFTSH